MQYIVKMMVVTQSTNYKCQGIKKDIKIGTDRDIIKDDITLFIITDHDRYLKFVLYVCRAGS